MCYYRKSVRTEICLIFAATQSFSVTRARLQTEPVTPIFSVLLSATHILQLMQLKTVVVKTKLMTTALRCIQMCL